MMKYAHDYLQGKASGGKYIDPGQERAMAAAGARTDQVKIGPVGVPISLLQTHHIMLRLMNVIGDNAHKMGPEWVDSAHVKITAALADVVTSSSMLTQLNDLIDLVTFQPGASVGRVTASQLNTQIPYGGLRNDLGNALNPYLKEINADLVSSFLTVTSSWNQWWQQLWFPLEQHLTVMLNQQPPFMQFFNAVSAVPLDLNRLALTYVRLNYNMRSLTYSTPSGDPCKLHLLRSKRPWQLESSQPGEMERALKRFWYVRKPRRSARLFALWKEVSYQTKFNAVLGDKESQQLLCDSEVHSQQFIQKFVWPFRSEAWNLRPRRCTEQSRGADQSRNTKWGLPNPSLTQQSMTIELQQLLLCMVVRQNHTFPFGAPFWRRRSFEKGKSAQLGQKQ